MNWLKAVYDATSLDRLLGVVNEYLLAFPDEHWSWIPPEGRPRLLASEEELHDWHRRLSELLAASPSANIRMQDLCVFFLRASARAIEIADAGGHSSNDGDHEPRGNNRETG